MALMIPIFMLSRVGFPGKGNDTPATLRQGAGQKYEKPPFL